MSKSKKTTTEPMNTVTLVLNKPAREMFGDATGVRVEFVDGYVRVRPTTRTKGLGNFDKGEIGVLPLHKTATAMKFTMPQTDAMTAEAFTIEALKYSWLAFRASNLESLPKGTPSAKVQLSR